MEPDIVNIKEEIPQQEVNKNEPEVEFSVEDETTTVGYEATGEYDESYAGNPIIKFVIFKSSFSRKW